MQRILVKYSNEKQSMAVKMESQGDLELGNTLLITRWFLKAFCGSDNMFRVPLEVSERRNRFRDRLRESVSFSTLSFPDMDTDTRHPKPLSPWKKPARSVLEWEAALASHGPRLAPGRQGACPVSATLMLSRRTLHPN